MTSGCALSPITRARTYLTRPRFSAPALKHETRGASTLKRIPTSLGESRSRISVSPCPGRIFSLRSEESLGHAWVLPNGSSSSADYRTARRTTNASTPCLKSGVWKHSPIDSPRGPTGRYRDMGPSTGSQSIAGWISVECNLSGVPLIPHALIGLRVSATRVHHDGTPWVYRGPIILELGGELRHGAHIRRHCSRS